MKPPARDRRFAPNTHHRAVRGGALKQFEGRTAHLEVSAAGDLGYEVGVNRIVLAGAHGDLVDVGKYLVVWKKINGQWYVAAISFTSDASAPTPAPRFSP